MTSVSGSYPSGAIGALSLRGWQASHERNLTTTSLMTGAVVGLMQAAGYGRIANVSSVSGPVAAHRGAVGYHAARAGIVGLTRGPASDTAGARCEDRRHGDEGARTLRHRMLRDR